MVKTIVLSSQPIKPYMTCCKIEQRYSFPCLINSDQNFLKGVVTASFQNLKNRERPVQESIRYENSVEIQEIEVKYRKRP